MEEDGIMPGGEHIGPERQIGPAGDADADASVTSQIPRSSGCSKGHPDAIIQSVSDGIRRSSFLVLPDVPKGIRTQ